MEDEWRADINQILLCLQTSWPQGAVAMWQSLTDKVPTLLDSDQGEKAFILWRMLLNIVPELLQTDCTEAALAMWRALTDQVLNIRRGKSPQAAAVLWKMISDQASSLLQLDRPEVTQEKWTVMVDQMADMVGKHQHKPEAGTEPTPILMSMPKPLPELKPEIKPPKPELKPKPKLSPERRLELMLKPKPEMNPNFACTCATQAHTSYTPNPNPKAALKPKPKLEPKQELTDRHEWMLKPKLESETKQEREQKPEIISIQTTLPNPGVEGKRLKPEPKPRSKLSPIQRLGPTVNLTPELNPKPNPDMKQKPKPGPKPEQADWDEWASDMRQVIVELGHTYVNSGHQHPRQNRRASWSTASSAPSDSSVPASQRPPGDRSPTPTGERFPVAVGGQSPIPAGGQSARPSEKPSPRPTSGWGRRRDSDAEAADSLDHEPGWVFEARQASDGAPVGSVDDNGTATRQSTYYCDMNGISGAEPAVTITNTDCRQESVDDYVTASRDSMLYCEIDEIVGVEATATVTNTVPMPPTRPLPPPPTRPLPPPPTRPLPSPPQQSGMSPPLLRPPTAPPPLPTDQTLWCRLPAVVGSGVLQRLNDEQRRLHEALFEVISSEASYHNSLLLLRCHFQEPLLRQSSSPMCQDSPQYAINDADYQQLFSNVDEVRQCSAAFLADLRRIQRNDIMLRGICEVVHRHAASRLYPYKRYCAHKILQDKKLKELTEQCQPFTKLLCWLESRSECRGLSLSSFLLLPLQRVTRLPLLMAAILKRLKPGHPERSSCEQACQMLTTLVQHCNEDADREKQRQKAAATADTNLNSDMKRPRSWRRRGVRRRSTAHDSDETPD